MSMKTQFGDDRRDTVQPQTDSSEHALRAPNGTLDLIPFNRSWTHQVRMSSSGGRTNLLPCLQMLFFSVFSLPTLWLQQYLLQLTTLMDPAGPRQRWCFKYRGCEQHTRRCFESENWSVQPHSFSRAIGISEITCIVKVFTNVSTVHARPEERHHSALLFVAKISKISLI